MEFYIHSAICLCNLHTGNFTVLLPELEVVCFSETLVNSIYREVTKILAHAVPLLTCIKGFLSSNLGRDNRTFEFLQVNAEILA